MNLEQGLQLFLKYLPVAIAIIKREGPTIQAFIADFKALQAGQAPSAVVPPVAQIATTTKFPP
jgi:hypothetical protein